jgi:DNA polymerase III subunit delta'
VKPVTQLSSRVLFSNIIGQEEVKQRLIRSFHEGRIAHALMFLGPEGSGNLPLALAFANYVCCAHRTHSDSCGSCATCRKFESLNFPDLSFSFPFFNKSKSGESGTTTCDDWFGEFREQVLENPYLSDINWRESLTEENKQFHVSVAEAANIVRKLSLKSFEGGYKFHILWMPEYLRVDTANKLLKTLEEPTKNTVFLLVANNTENILSTILSRVQVIQIPKIADATIVDSLKERGIGKETAADIAHYANGNWNLALQLAASADPNQALTRTFVDWMRACYRKEMTQLARFSEERHAETRGDQQRFLRYALSQIRDNLVLNYAGHELVRMNAGEREFSVKFSPFINDTNAIEMMDLLTEADSDIGRNTYSKMTFMDISLKMYYLLHRKA